MKIAFDYGGTLRVSDGRESMRTLAACLLTAGFEVCVISAILRNSYWEDKIFEELRRDVHHSLGPVFSKKDVWIVYYDNPNPSEQEIYRIGCDKAFVMKERDVDILIDDSAIVCRAVRDYGLTALNLI